MTIACPICLQPVELVPAVTVTALVLAEHPQNEATTDPDFLTDDGICFGSGHVPKTLPVAG